MKDARNGYTGRFICQHALPRQEFSFERHKDKVVKQNTNLSCYNCMELYERTETLLIIFYLVYMVETFMSPTFKCYTMVNKQTLSKLTMFPSDEKGVCF